MHREARKIIFIAKYFQIHKYREGMWDMVWKPAEKEIMGRYNAASRIQCRTLGARQRAGDVSYSSIECFVVLDLI